MKIDNIILWYNQKTKKEQWFYLLLGFAIFYFIWDSIVYAPIKTKNIELNKTILTTNAELTITKTQLEDIERVVTHPNFKASLVKQKTLTERVSDLNAYINETLPAKIKPQNYDEIIKSLLLNSPGVQLMSLKKLPIQPWIDAELTSIVTSVAAQEIQKNRNEIIFTADYFSTLNFLQRLEKLPWNVKWESLDYKVTNYPKAQITLVFYVLQNKKS